MKWLDHLRHWERVCSLLPLTCTALAGKSTAAPENETIPEFNKYVVAEDINETRLANFFPSLFSVEKLRKPAGSQVLSPSVGAHHAVHAHSRSAVDHTAPPWAFRIHKVKPLKEPNGGRRAEDEEEQGRCPMEGLSDHFRTAECPPSLICDRL